MNVNKSKVHEDFKLVVEKLKLIVKGFLIPLIYGLPYFYFYSQEPIEAVTPIRAVIFAMILIWFAGIIVLFCLTIIFAILSKLERRYIDDSFLIAYILRKYIAPFESGEIADINYDNIKDGYKKFKASNIIE